ncbi:MAG: hypothetical protein HUJ75_01230, partial [Parasporobacterium sp.]|nr:hypothetical protein [Parasporobacterium sp.]
GSLIIYYYTFVKNVKTKVYVNSKGEFFYEDAYDANNPEKRFIRKNSVSDPGSVVRTDGFNYIISLKFNDAIKNIISGTVIHVEVIFEDSPNRQKGEELGGGNSGLTVDDVLTDVITTKTDANRATESLVYDNDKKMDPAGIKVEIDTSTFDETTQGLVSIDAVPCTNPNDNDREEYWFKAGQGVKLNITPLVDTSSTIGRKKWSVESVIIEFTTKKENSTLTAAQSRTVKVNEKGEYVFTMPSNLAADKPVVVKVKFTDTKNVTDGSASSTQYTGSFAVVVATNNASASISGGANISLTGDLKNSSSATTEIENTADARAAVPSEGGGGGGGGGQTEEVYGPTQVSGGTINKTVVII